MSGRGTTSGGAYSRHTTAEVDARLREVCVGRDIVARFDNITMTPDEVEAAQIIEDAEVAAAVGPLVFSTPSATRLAKEVLLEMFDYGDPRLFRWPAVTGTREPGGMVSLYWPRLGNIIVDREGMTMWVFDRRFGVPADGERYAVGSFSTGLNKFVEAMLTSDFRAVELQPISVGPPRRVTR